MRQLLLLALLASAAWAQTRVEIRENEVWLIDGGQAKQLTHDGRSKPQVLHSWNFNRIVFYEQCPQDEHCLPSVIVLDHDGNRLQSFQPHPSVIGGPSPCFSILNIAWADEERAIGVECHESPSLSEYVEVEPSTGKTLRDLTGIRFTPSPTGNHIAFVGPLIHFAPPYAQSNYLLVDGVTTYPLPKGLKPHVAKEGEQPIDVVREEGSRYVGIHSFAPEFSWSPDSTRVAFIDCVFDWIEKGTDPDGGGGSVGEAVNDTCSIAAVALDGSVALFPLPRDVPPENARLSWTADGVVLTWTATRTYKVH